MQVACGFLSGRDRVDYPNFITLVHSNRQIALKIFSLRIQTLRNRVRKAAKRCGTRNFYTNCLVYACQKSGLRNALTGIYSSDNANMANPNFLFINNYVSSLIILTNFNRNGATYIQSSRRTFDAVDDPCSRFVSHFGLN